MPDVATLAAEGRRLVAIADLKVSQIEMWYRERLGLASMLSGNVGMGQWAERGIRDGWLKEGAASNIFVVKDGMLLAPPKTSFMLPGITYDVVLELAACHCQPLEVREIQENELRAADEVWMTSSTKEVLAITTLDGAPVGNGKPGPLGERMWQWYQDFKNTVMRKD